jgi:hypothetical protein
MKKSIALLALVVAFSSCKLKDAQEDAQDVKANAAIKDSTAVNDKDENGCLASAGYIWSKVNKECVKVFSGLQLNPNDKPDNADETLSAYILFSEDLKQAEVFLPNETSSIILSGSDKTKVWSLGDWQLVANNGYVLKKAGADKFSGDGEIGKKVTGSDTEQ